MADPESNADKKPAPKVDQPMDFTVVVGESEFAVHKAVLIEASHFFRDMFSGAMVESKSNRVKLQGLDAEVVRKLVEFVYTGDEDVVSDNPKQMLQCASYLQMPAAIEACTKRLVSCLSPSNCMDILSMFLSLSLEGVNAVKAYVKSNVSTVKQQCPIRLMPLEGIQVIIDFWNGTEMKAFTFVELWISGDINRDHHTNDLMCRVRFALMTRWEIFKVKRNQLYKGCQEAWCELVDSASVYHKLPMHLKVLDDSLQTQVRADPTPVLFTQHRDEDSVVYHSLDKENKWRAHGMTPAKMPKFSDTTVGVEVNNFYIVNTGRGHRYGWRIFNPRTQAWGKMKGLDLPEIHFEVVYHDKHLYAIGGRLPGKDKTCIRLERYSFESNSWTSMPSMPLYVTRHAACVVGGTLYVCGGFTENLQDEESEDDDLESEYNEYDEIFSGWNREADDLFSSRLYSLDLTCPSPTWTKLRSCPQRLIHHAACAMKVKDTEVVAVVEEGFEVCLYNPSTAQWSKDVSFMRSFYDYKLASGRSMITKGRKFFFMNMFALPKDYEPGQEEECSHGPQCALWTLTDDKPYTVEHDVEPLPYEEYACPFGAMLALPPSVTGRRCRPWWGHSLSFDDHE